MRMAGVGGTFNVLHRGHRALLDKAFEVADSVAVGITSDRFSTRTKSIFVPLEKRMVALADFLSKKEKQWYITVIDTPMGTAVTNPDFTDLVVSERTIWNAEKINEARKRNRLVPLRIHIVPHILADDFVPISSSRVLKGEIDAEGHLSRPLRVAVGSRNEIKINATRKMMTLIYDCVEVLGVDASTSVREQPWEEETVKDAVQRAKEAARGADLGVGIEAGVWPREQGLFDIQFCAIVDKMGKVTIGHGSAFQYPLEVERRVGEGATIRDAFRDIFAWEKDGKREGAVGFLSCGLMTRTELTEQAVLAAMIPRIRKDLYSES